MKLVICLFIIFITSIYSSFAIITDPVADFLQHKARYPRGSNFYQNDLIYRFDADLNQDGKQEVLVSASWARESSLGYLFYIYSLTNQGFEEVGQIDLNLRSFYLGKIDEMDAYGIVSYWQSGPQSGKYEAYIFDDKKIKKIPLATLKLNDQTESSNISGLEAAAKYLNYFYDFNFPPAISNAINRLRTEHGYKPNPSNFIPIKVVEAKELAQKYGFKIQTKTRQEALREITNTPLRTSPMPIPHFVLTPQQVTSNFHYSGELVQEDEIGNDFKKQGRFLWGKGYMSKDKKIGYVIVVFESRSHLDSNMLSHFITNQQQQDERFMERSREQLDKIAQATDLQTKQKLQVQYMEWRERRFKETYMRPIQLKNGMLGFIYVSGFGPGGGMISASVNDDYGEFDLLLSLIVSNNDDQKEDNSLPVSKEYCTNYLKDMESISVLFEDGLANLYSMFKEQYMTELSKAASNSGYNDMKERFLRRINDPRNRQLRKLFNTNWPPTRRSIVTNDLSPTNHTKGK